MSLICLLFTLQTSLLDFQGDYSFPEGAALISANEQNGQECLSVSLKDYIIFISSYHLNMSKQNIGTSNNKKGKVQLGASLNNLYFYQICT